MGLADDIEQMALSGHSGHAFALLVDRGQRELGIHPESLDFDSTRQGIR